MSLPDFLVGFAAREPCDFPLGNPGPQVLTMSSTAPSSHNNNPGPDGGIVPIPVPAPALQGGAPGPTGSGSGFDLSPKIGRFHRHGTFIATLRNENMLRIPGYPSVNKHGNWNSSIFYHL